MIGHPWTFYLMTGGMAFAITLILVPLFRNLALRIGVVDAPSEARKVHTRAIPYLGGAAFYLSFLAVVLMAEIFFPRYSSPVFFPLALVGTCIVLMGLYDDVRDMSSIRKLALELVLCSVLFFQGFRTTEIAHPLGGVFDVGWLAFFITPLWIAGVINAVNFSDGLDGLAAGLVFICAAAVFAISVRGGQVVSCVLMAYLMGAALGFLPWNFHPASVFMGDAGALFLGFILGAATLVENQKGAAVIALAVPMVVIGVPIADTVLSFLRRLQRARRGAFFQPDRDHLHHRLLNLGLSQRQVVVTLYYISAFMGLLAFVLSVAPAQYGFLILLLAAMAILFGVIVLRFVEGFARRQTGGEDQMR
jgi:UDP-GlcNAc:undecaprenyl-phosphate/decaprenyl-phosphate GlcNAc-1-phosphate transferase